MNRFDAVDGLREWLNDMPFTHFVTFNFNRPEGYDSATKAIRKWHAGVDRALLGKRFHKRPPNERTTFWAFFEHPDTNLHAHALVIASHPNFDVMAKSVWKKIVPSGELHISDGGMDKTARTSVKYECYQPIQTTEGRAYAVRYALKSQACGDVFNRYIFSNTFMNK